MKFTALFVQHTEPSSVLSRSNSKKRSQISTYGAGVEDFANNNSRARKDTPIASCRGDIHQNQFEDTRIVNKMKPREIKKVIEFMVTSLFSLAIHEKAKERSCEIAAIGI